MNICYTLHYSLGFCFGRCKNIKTYVFLIILNFICKLKKTEQEINNYQSKKDILRIVKIKSDSSSAFLSSLLLGGKGRQVSVNSRPVWPTNLVL